MDCASRFLAMQSVREIKNGDLTTRFVCFLTLWARSQNDALGDVVEGRNAGNVMLLINHGLDVQFSHSRTAGNEVSTHL